MTAAIKRMRRRNQVLLGVLVLVTIMVILFGIFGSAGRNNEFQPQNEFKLDDWLPIHLGALNLSINKAVLYLWIAVALTTITMVYIAKRMQQRPNNVQTAVEWGYDFASTQIVRSNMDRALATKWFPFIASLFFFILFSNLIGYLPLPINSQETINILGAEIPAFAIYSATANISIPLVLTLVVWFSYHVEGIRAKGFRGYFKGWIPSGSPGFLLPLIVPIEVISHFVRIISLSVRLFANLLAGHLLILFMGGGLVVILGLAFLGPLTLIVAILFFLFEMVLIAGLQAFIFATLTAIYIGEATSEGHEPDRKEPPWRTLQRQSCKSHRAAARRGCSRSRSASVRDWARSVPASVLATSSARSSSR
jgi:F-type H+-transporting ATPase subunit a